MVTEGNSIMHRRLVFILCALVLTACQLSNESTSQPAPTSNNTHQTAAAATAHVQLTNAALHRAATATARAQLTETAIPRPTVVPIATVEPAPTFSSSPYPNQVPKFDPEKIPGLLQSALSVETLEPFNSHGLRRVTGWSYGFESFQWMDTNHLLLYPITGQVMIEMAGKVEESYPSVVNLSSQRIWFPPSNVPVRKYGIYGGPMLPRWSDQLGALLASETDTSTGIYGSEGNLIKTYEGNLIGVSPSATKILVSERFVDSTWIDLRNGKKVTFPWKNINRQMDSSYIRPIWSPDEMRVYAGYHIYGDAKTGESFEMPGTTVDGEKTDLLFLHFYGTWVLGGKYMLAQWNGVWDGTPGFVAFFDPAAKSYRNLSDLAGIPYELNELPQEQSCNNNSPSTTLGGRYIWIDCSDGGHLVDLATFQSQSYPGYSEAHLDWSADGRFAWITRYSDSAPRILSVSGKELKLVPVDTQFFIWHPTKNILAYLSNEGRTLGLLEPQTLSVQKEVALPVKFQELIWSPDEHRIALFAEDGKLWQIDYPGLGKLEQLTSALPTPAATPSGMKPGMNNNVVWSFADTFPARLGRAETGVRNIVWSPDGTSLAFIGNTDIYIVETQVKP
jgi:hypothetical protein